MSYCANNILSASALILLLFVRSAWSGSICWFYDANGGSQATYCYQRCCSYGTVPYGGSVCCNYYSSYYWWVGLIVGGVILIASIVVVVVRICCCQRYFRSRNPLNFQRTGTNQGAPKPRNTNVYHINRPTGPNPPYPPAAPYNNNNNVNDYGLPKYEEAMHSNSNPSAPSYPPQYDSARPYSAPMPAFPEPTYKTTNER